MKDKKPTTRLECRQDAHSIVAMLIESYFDVGQPHSDYEDRGWSEALADRTALELQGIAARHRRLGKGRV